MEYLFLGVDIAKDYLVVYDGHHTYTFPNQRNLEQFQQFLKKRYQGKEKRLVVIYEPTGPYSAFLEEVLALKQLKAVRLNPRKIPYLQEVVGKRAKTDGFDAQTLYNYQKFIDPSEIQVLKLDQKKEKLALLLSDYFFLRQQENNFANHLEALKRSPFSSSESIRFMRKHLQLFREQQKALRKKMEELTKEDEEIEKAVGKMGEIKGVGFLTALGLSLLFKRRRVRNRGEVVALLGLDPLVKQSGKGQGPRRISRRGDKKLRGLLYMATLSAIKANEKIREFYFRLRSKGKPGKVAVVACMRKLALMCWAHYKIAFSLFVP